MIEVQETGLRGVQSALRKFPAEVRSQLPRMVKEAAEPVRARAQTLAPWKTGALAGSVRIVGGSNRIAVRAGGKKAFYARFQEYGTKKMPAHPFLKPAVEERGDRVRDVIDREMRQLIERTF